MKKVLLIAAIAVASLSASAQTEKGKTKFGIALEAGIPTGDAGDVYDLAIGGSLLLEHPITTSLNLTGSAGFTSWSIKNDVKDTYKALGIDTESPSFIPVKAGAKYYFAKNFYAQGELGAAFGTKKGYDTGFIWTPGLGLSYPVSDKTDFDAGVRYESWSANGGSTDQIAFRVALKF